MEIEILEMEERKARFILRNSSPAMANALRRTLLTDLPKMAIDKVEFHLGPVDMDGKEYESTTPLFDEIIAHRLGMVPVPTDLDLFVPQEECSCHGEGFCPNCTIMYSLNKHGPCTVYSGDLMPLGNPDLKVKDEFIPIVELTDGQAVMIYAYAVMGTAKKHVKWQVCNGVGYSYLPVIDIDEKHASDEDMIEVAKVCPKHVYGVEGGKLTVVKPRDCNLCMSCVESIGAGRGLSVTGDDTQFVFKFETDGSLTARQALDKAVEILSEEAQAFKVEIESLEAQ
ncbi:DNA-directed RNA polymerase subunit D [Candidatus Methanoprimaticola sp. MG2]|uniref:DNA-directed RNA polymerase subunit D n=1 Tax=Candidatus Methanoprimaticola sp. MG2 TaxID=3228838 RepID=UPI0039C6617C